MLLKTSRTQLALSFLLVNALAFPALGAFKFPSDLDSSDRKKITEIMGLGNSTKLTSNPYPLGGYSGVEIGLSFEQLNTEDVSRLGNADSVEKDFSYSRITVGKGIYNDIDIFGHFIPYSETTGYSDYGALLRYCFFQAAFLPASFSLILHANNSNISNVFFSETRGVELLSGLNVQNLSLYVGVGQVWATALFAKSLNLPISGQQSDERSNVSGLHTYAGAAFDIEPYFLAVQIDQFTQSVFSGKLGFRF